MPLPVTLAGRHITLIPLEPEHAHDIYSLTHGAERDSIWVEMKVGPFEGPDQFDAHVAELIADRSRTFLTLVSYNGAPLGWMCLMEAEPKHASIELGYVLLSPALQRTTAASESFLLVMRYVFDVLGYQRLEWTCTAENFKSRRAADRLGLTFEGIMRDKLVLKGRRRDICIYSMLAR